MKKKVAVVWGTRPELIKLSRFIILAKEHFDLIQVHTGQHYDHNMYSAFVKELGTGEPDFKLVLKENRDIYQFIEMQRFIFESLEKINPDMVVVQGDTNSTLAGALCANKLNFKLLHIEAGGRSYNRDMPEESNRKIVDHISDLLACYDQESFNILHKEGLNQDRVIINVQNTSFEVANYHSKKIPTEKVDIDMLVTSHRKENVDNPKILRSFVAFLNKYSSDYEKKIVLPLHPRTKKMMSLHGLKLDERIINPGPVSYYEMLKLLKKTRLVLTDSGGLVDDAMALKKPIYIFREKIEQNRIIADGLAKLVSPQLTTDQLIKYFMEIDDEALIKMSTAKNNLDFDVSNKIINAISHEINS